MLPNLAPLIQQNDVCIDLIDSSRRNGLAFGAHHVAHCPLPADSRTGSYDASHTEHYCRVGCHFVDSHSAYFELIHLALYQWRQVEQVDCRRLGVVPHAFIVHWLMVAVFCSPVVPLDKLVHFSHV